MSGEAGLPSLDCPLVKDAAAWKEPGGIWAACQPFALRESRDGGRPREQTEVRAAWTPERLFVRFECEDADPWATLTERDGPLWEEEVVEVFVDPFGDLQCYFEFEVNPLNTVLDVVIRRSPSGWKKDFAWRCEGFETAVARTAAGWTAAFSIPFAGLTPRAARPGDSWRGNFLRIDRPKGTPRQLSAWSPTLCDTFHVPERFGTIRFI